VTRHDEHGSVGLQALGVLDDLEAIHFGHADVHQQKVYPVFLEVVDGFTRVSLGFHPIARTRKKALAKECDARFVVDDKYLWRFHD
jgi:hypothetical protein